MKPAIFWAAFLSSACGVIPQSDPASASLVIDNNAGESAFDFSYTLDDGFQFFVTSGKRIGPLEAAVIEGAFVGADRERMTVKAAVTTDGIYRVNEYATTLADGMALGFAYSFDDQGNFQMRWAWESTGAPRRQR